MMNWQNNKGTKILFVIQWLFLLLFFVLAKIFFPKGDGSGALMILVVPCFGGFILFGIAHIIRSIFIEKDRADKIFLTINIIATILILSWNIFLKIFTFFILAR